MLRLVLTPPCLRAAIAAVCLATAVPVRAALTWETQEQRFKLSADEASAQTRFGFTNTGSQPVSITEMLAGCSCAAATAAKRTFAPGERGEIVVDFKRGNREGEYRQGVTINTDDGVSTTLWFVADIEVLVRFDPRYVFWTATEPRTPKHMRLTFAAGHQATLTAVDSSDPQFRTTFTPAGKAASAVDLTIIPPATASNFTILTIRFRLDGSDADRELTAVARTLPAKNEPVKTGAKPQP